MNSKNGSSSTPRATHCYADIVALTMQYPYVYEVVIDWPSPKRGIARIRCFRDQDDENLQHLPICLWKKDMHMDRCLELYRQILLARQKHEAAR